MALQGSGVNLQGSSVNLNNASLGNAQKGVIYWVGANGNVYSKGAGGNSAKVTDLGKNNGSTVANLILNGAKEIADPNVPQAGGGGGGATAPSNPNGAAAAPKKVDKSNDIALQLAGLAAVDEQYNTGVASVDKALAQLQGRYTEERTANEKSYTDSTNNNIGNLQKNKQTTYVNAAQGRQGLFGQLSGIGALSGDGIALANRAVQQGANADLAGADENFQTNADTLNGSIEAFRRDDKYRTESANTSAENAKTNAKNEAAKARLSFYSNLVNDYSAMEDEGNAKAYTAKAQAQYPELAKSAVGNANLAYTGAAFTPTTLENYLAGNDSNVVSIAPTQPGQTIPGLVASATKKKQLLATV